MRTRPTEGNQEFTFVWVTPPSPARRANFVSSVVGEGQWLVEGDIDGDGVGDFASWFPSTAHSR
jgi:hypothetical protein